MINEGAKLIEEGIVERASDIDAVWLSGFGWPTWKGGPMYWADTQGAGPLLARMNALHASHGEAFKPATLLERLSREGGSFVNNSATI
jgi:3-hydroxyacyl-CoA dehydrogenase